MSVRSSISRREPVISLKAFRYRGRNYKEGSYLDRRRCHMPNGKLKRLIREGACILAKDLDSEKLRKYGYTYNNEAPRLKLKIGNSPNEITMEHVGAGWYDVMLNGKTKNEKKLRKTDALELLASLKEG